MSLCTACPLCPRALSGFLPSWSPSGGQHTCCLDGLKRRLPAWAPAGSGALSSLLRPRPSPAHRQSSCRSGPHPASQLMTHTKPTGPRAGCGARCRGQLASGCLRARFHTRGAPPMADDYLDWVQAAQGLSAQVALTAKVFLPHPSYAPR